MSLPDKKKTSGFSLIELMVVMTVISVLATMALYGLGKAQASARDSSRQQIMTGIQVALERYYGDNQAYPAGTFCTMLGTLVSGSTYLASRPNDPKDKAPTGVLCTACGSNNPSCGGATYTYVAVPSGTTPNQQYTLTLTKESGGPSVFVSPQ